MEYHITPEQALRNLHETLGEESIELLKLGSLSVRFYSPKGSDRQQPHTRDEVYLVVSGSGTFRCCNQARRISEGMCSPFQRARNTVLSTSRLTSQPGFSFTVRRAE